MSDSTALGNALAKLDEAMRPSLGGGADPARRRCAQRLAQLARCGDEELPAFAKRHMPGREVDGSELRVARDLLLAIDGIADLEEGGPDAWAALAEVKEVLERRVATAKENAKRRKAEAEAALIEDDESTVAGSVGLPPLEPPRLYVDPPDPIAPPVRGPSALGTTGDVPFGFLPPPLPFRPASPAAVEEPRHAEEPRRAEGPRHAEGRSVSDDPSEMTMAVRLPLGAASALPFGATPWVPTTPRLDPKRSPVAPKLPVDENPLESTGKVRALTGLVLPFRPSLPGLEGTPPPSSRAPTFESAPRAPASEPVTQLSISQYASLCAELTVFPEAAEGIFRRYGLDADEKRSAVDAAWKERLRLDPAEYSQWLDLYQRYRAVWTKHG